MFEEIWENSWAVVGFSRERAENIMDEIERVYTENGKEVERRIRREGEMKTRFVDGTLLQWVKTSSNMRGYKFGKIWCDKSIDEECLSTMVLPMYFGKKENIIWL